MKHATTNNACTFKPYTLTEFEIIRKCIQGDRRSQNKLYNLYFEKTFIYCFNRLGNEEDAKDAVQAGFINVFRYIHRFNFSRPFAAWIKVIMRNTVITFYKEKIKRKPFLPILPNEYVIKSIEATPLDDFYEKDLKRKVNLLPASYKTIFELYLSGYSTDEISFELSIPKTKTVKYITICSYLFTHFTEAGSLSSTVYKKLCYADYIKIWHCNNALGGGWLSILKNDKEAIVQIEKVKEQRRLELSKLKNNKKRNVPSTPNEKIK